MKDDGLEKPRSLQHRDAARLSVGGAVPYGGPYDRMEGDGRVVCELCPRACRLREGQLGMCFVRACKDGHIVLGSYGRSTGFCIDPIEKKPLFHFLPGTPVLSFGTAGCNLACKFCQNWETSRARDVERMSEAATADAIAAAAVRFGCRSVAMTYNDPVVFFEYAVDVADACRRHDLRTIAVSAGYMMPAPRAELYQRIDAANIDLKGFSERFYRDLCGGELAYVLDTLVYLREKTKVWMEITTLLIPGENDSDRELDAMTRWLVGNLGADVPLHFSAFHPDFRLLDRPPTPLSTLQRARRIGLGNGLHHVYIGNVHDEDGSSTTCSGCGAKLIGRLGYHVTAWNVTDGGNCTTCAKPCVGLFDGPAGTWGNRRLPIHV